VRSRLRFNAKHKVLAVTSPLLPTYARADVAFERGEGPWVFASDGRRFLDFGAGIAVNALGHAHPHLIQALTGQAQKIWHTSNLYKIPGQERLGQRLVDATFADVAFFCNSGAEAIECAIKMTRKHFAHRGKPEKFRIVTFEGAFHGRTLATIAAGHGGHSNRTGARRRRHSPRSGPIPQGVARSVYGT
jgi:acetylornithine/N-succinyldiaminopimelate aminotransferase